MMRRTLQATGEPVKERAAILRRLLDELAPHRARVTLLFGLVILGAAAQAIAPWLVSRAIGRDILGRDPVGLGLTTVALFGVYLAATLLNRSQTALVGTVGQRILASLRVRLFDRFQHLPLAYFDRAPVGDLMSRVTSDIDTLNQLLSQGMAQLLGSLFSLVGILVAMLALNLPLGLVTLTVVPAVFWLTDFFARQSRRAFRSVRETTGNVSAGLQEDIVGLREAQAFNRTQENIERFQTRNAANRDANVQAVAITSAFTPAIDVLSTLATAAVLGFGGWLALRGQIDLGLLAAFVIYVQLFFRPLQLLSQVYTQAQSALAGAERIYQILDEPSESIEPAGTPQLATVAGRIDFESVHFAYTPGRPVLKGVSFTVLPGCTLALVGKTGSGKTTIASLIARFFEVDSGTVRVDGQDVRLFTRDSLRRQLALVLQEPFLFSGTVAENIAYGRHGASRTDVEGAARAVGAHGFIERLPEGYDTPVGEAGNALSQGQRQLLACARAVIASARILILDEATSNIDTRTEAQLQQALAVLLSGRTSVVIAHRLSTVEKADLILVLDDGHVAEQGTHAELLRRDGLYAELYRRQFRDEPEPVR